MHRALLAEQTVKAASGAQVPLYCRTFYGSPPTKTFSCATRTKTEKNLILPSVEALRDPIYNDVLFLHPSWNWRPLDWPSRVQTTLAPKLWTYYQPILQGGGGHGGFLNVCMQPRQNDDHCYLCHYVDYGSDATPQLVEDYSSLAELLCLAKYYMVDFDEPWVDHQLCMLAALLAHRLAPCESETRTMRLMELLADAEELVAVAPRQDDEEEDVDDVSNHGKLSPWTVSFLKAAIDGAIPLAQASDYITA